jgi:hypothetical protein
LVLGDDISAWCGFPVMIAKSETVGGLKKTIGGEKEPEFDDYAANRLDLWKLDKPLPIAPAKDQVQRLAKLGTEPTTY